MTQMSYTEFLRRKASAAPIIIDTTVRSDASTITMRRRLQANNEFFLSARQGVINNVSDPSGTGTTSRLKAAMGTTKVSGGRIPDASVFTAFVGGDAINSDGGIFQKAQRYVANSNTVGSISNCVVIDSPSPYVSGIASSANTVPQNASNIVRNLRSCVQPSTEPHIQNELGPSEFVGDTIALNRSIGLITTYATDVNGSYLGANRVDNIPAATVACPRVNHTHPQPFVPVRYMARPTHGQGGIPIFVVPSPDDARKVGNRNPRKIPYIETHHGNDLNVNPRQLFKKYQIPIGPAHLKINETTHYPVS